MRKRIKIAMIIAVTLLSLASVSAVNAGPYSTAENNTNPGAPDPGIPGFVGPDGDGKIGGNNYVNPVFKEWASEVADYSPSNQTIQPQWTNASKALGPVTGDNFDIVSLGDLNETQIQAGENPGSITLGFETPIVNGEGADFAVFENGFISAGGAGVAGEIFAELGYVEVSTDGVNFVRFPSVSLTPDLVGAYGTVDPTDVYNLVSKHCNAYSVSWGTPFDLDDLVNMTEVIDGLVNLNDINYVKIVDIPGNGFFLDSHGNPIYDAWVTWGSGGLDLEAVGVINTVLEQVVNDRTGLTYSTIQEAIDDVNTINGDTIIVNAGNYIENVIVNKNLLLNALEAIVNPLNAALPVFTVTSSGSGSIIQGFIISGSAIGIFLNGTENNTIHNNTVVTNQTGVDSYGVHLIGSNNNQITGNNVTTNGDTVTYGVYLENSSSNVFYSNIIDTIGLADDVDWSDYMEGGIYSTLSVFISNDSSGNNVTDNTITTNYNAVSGSGYDTILGVQIRKDCDGNNLIGNTIDTIGYSYAYGLEVVGGYGTESTANVVSNNIINTVGEYIYANGLKVGSYTENTLVSGNDISATAPDFAYGIYLENFTGLLRNVNITGNNVNTAANVNYIIEIYAASGTNLNNGNKITNNVLTGVGNYTLGIATIGSRYNTISNNTISITGDNSAAHIPNADSIPESNDGIKLYTTSRNNLVKDNIISGNIVAGSTSSNGIRLYRSTYNTLENNTINNSFTNGIYLENTSDNNSITGNNVNSGIDSGIYVGSSTGNTILNNIILGNDTTLWGISIVDSNGTNSIIGNNMSGYTEGINFYNTMGATITGNSVTDNVYDGIALTQSNNNTITGNSGSGNVSGVRLNTSNGNLVSNNDLTGNIWAGVSLVDSQFNEIINNTASNCQEGIYLYNSTNNTISGNIANNNVWDGIALHDSNNNAVSDNLNITGNNCGIRIIGDSSGNQVLNNTVSGNTWSNISLDTAGNTTIRDNTLTNSHVGIYLFGSSENTIQNNTIVNNDWDGVYIGNDSNNNTVTENTVSDGGYGVRIQDSTGNTVYMNNFDSNYVQAFDDSNNQWDNGTTGNYYDDWGSTDPRPVDGGSNVDNYPSLTPFES